MVTAAAAAPLRIIFFGTPAFAVPTLDALIASPHPVVGVVTQPDRPRGRGQKTSDAPVKARAVAAGLAVLQPETMKDPAFLEALRSLHADLGVVAAYGRILTDAVLTTPRLGMINVHASLLPHYRGAAPVHRAIISGERETGVTIMRVVKALDAGPMLANVHHAIQPNETSAEVERDLARLGSHLLVASVDRIAEGRAQEEPQDEAAATYARRLTKDDGLIDWSVPALRVHNLIRGLHPWPHAFSFLQGERFILRRSTINTAGPKGPAPHQVSEPASPHGPGPQQTAELSGPEGGLRESDVGRALSDPPKPREGDSDPPDMPGTILEADGDRLIIATGDGPLRVVEIQAEGKRPMGAREFLAGHSLTVGDRFTAAP